MPAALPVDWTAIKEAMIAGVTAPELAARFGMWKKDPVTGEPITKEGKQVPDTTAIRGRCFRERWPVPASIRERATKELHKQRKHAQAQTQAYITQGAHQPQQEDQTTQITLPPTPRADQAETVKHPPQSLEIIAEKLAKIGESHPLAMAEYAARKRDTMIAKDLLPVPTNWREAGQMDTILRRAVGLERAESAGVQVNVGVWGSGGKVDQWQGGEYDV